MTDYTYSVTGAKQHTTYTVGNTVSRYDDYCGNMLYEQIRTPDLILREEIEYNKQFLPDYWNIPPF